MYDEDDDVLGEVGLVEAIYDWCRSTDELVVRVSAFFRVS